MKDMNVADDALPSNTQTTAFQILIAISVGHLLNDMIQSLIPSIYPILKQSYGLSFAEVGLITLTWQGTASILQPIIGWITDRKGQPFSLAVGMGFTLTGLLVLSQAFTFLLILLGVDHILAMVSVGLLAVNLGGRAVWAVPASFVAMMVMGGVLGMAGFSLPLNEVGIGFSVLVLGSIVALSVRLPVSIAMALRKILFRRICYIMLLPL